MNTDLHLQIYENVLTSPDNTFIELEKEVHYFPPEESNLYMNEITATIPREITAFGEPNLSYIFSGVTPYSQPWTPLLIEIKNIVENVCGLNFNSVLVTRYPNGSTHIDHHNDNETDMEDKYPIASLSLGETRAVVFKRSSDTYQTFKLNSNTLLVMKDPSNRKWSLGITNENNRTGVRINLSFYMMKNTINIFNKNTPKRKNDEPKDLCNKKVKKENIQVYKEIIQVYKENIQSSGCFSEDDIPVDQVPIGENVFVRANNYYDEVIVQIRRYRKFEKIYYPTKEGVTLQPRWVESIMHREKLPQSEQELDTDFILDGLYITSKDFNKFLFTRTKISWKNDLVSRSITLSAKQWYEMIRQYSTICKIVLNRVFASIDFLSVYTTITAENIPESLPPSIDVCLGMQYLRDTLKTVFCDLVKERGLKEVQTLDEEVWGNRVETFNGAVFSLEAEEIANTFHNRLWVNQSFLHMKPVCYVTREFLDSVQLNNILRDVRLIFCSSAAFKFFEDHENK